VRSLSREARHPNVVLYLGLSRAPDPDNRIFIVSEYIENGLSQFHCINAQSHAMPGSLRGYILNKSRRFPWHLRLSFATDIARALAYLHARNCIHRDLKGENLLVTSNGRLKVTDFGFARIAARNEDESKRLTFCGTDSYMSPEILRGEEFDLQTDIFSLGVIFCEIGSRKLADDCNYRRIPPDFNIDCDEVHRLASPDCPPSFLSLCLDCLADDPKARPSTRVILERLRKIEDEVLARPSEQSDMHVGSIRFMSTTRPPKIAPRIPSFRVRNDSASGSSAETSTDDSDEEPNVDLDNIDADLSKMMGKLIGLLIVVIV
jgi:LIM domain kinase 1